MIKQVTSSQKQLNVQKSSYHKINREKFIKQIIEKYPKYSLATNFDRFDIIQLESIAKYGDERAERESEYVEYDYGPTFTTNAVSGMRVALNQPLDPHFQQKQNVKIALKLAGSKTIRNVVKVKNYSDREKRILKIFDIFLNIDEGKYRRLLKTLEKNISEIAIASRKNKGTKNLVKLIAACIVKNGSLFRIDVTTQDMEYEILKLGKELDLKGYKDFDRSNFNDFLDLASNMNFYKVKKKMFCEENALFSKYKRPERKKRVLKIPDRLITIDTSRFVAQRYVSELFNKGIVKESIQINRLINDIDSHYQEFFKLNQNISKVTAVIAIRLFNKELKIPNLVRQILSIDNLSYDIELKNKIEGQCRLEERRGKSNDGSALIKDHIGNGYIRRMYSGLDQSSEVKSNNDGITIICSKLYRHENAKVTVSNYCVTIIGMSRLSKINYPNYQRVGVITPVITKYNHITHFNKKDG